MGAVYFSDGVVRFRDADESDDGGFGLPEEAAGVAVGETVKVGLMVGVLVGVAVSVGVRCEGGIQPAAWAVEADRAPTTRATR